MAILDWFRTFWNNVTHGRFKVTSDRSLTPRSSMNLGVFQDGADILNDVVGTSSGNGIGLYDALTNLVNNWSGAHMTNAEVERNEMQMQNQEDIYQRQVAGMQKAGLNPALMYGSGAQSAPSAPAAQSPGINMSELMELMTLKKRMSIAQQDADSRTLSSEAAMKQADAAARNAGSGEQNAVTNRMNAVTNRMLAQIENDKVVSQIGLNDAEKQRIAAQTAFIDLQREQLPVQLEIAQKNADSAAKSAIASLRQAEAAVQNAATNDRLSDYECSLKYTQELLTWYQSEGAKVTAQYLPERSRAEIDNLIKEGVYLDKRGNLVDRQGHLVTAQTVKTYVNVGTDISGAVNQWLNPLSKGPSGSVSPGFDLSGAYQGVAYGYD